MRTRELAGISILGSLVIIFDYVMKFSGFKIQFPWLPFLKFDFTGIPIFLSLLVYGLPSGSVTSIVSFLAIYVRSGDVIGSSMKAIAELSTVLGAVLFVRTSSFLLRLISFVFSVGLRMIVMSVLNIVVLPTAYGMPFQVIVSMLPWIAIFNAIQGSISFLGGYSLFKLLRKRITITDVIQKETVDLGK